jgi:hypothetical protein
MITLVTDESTWIRLAALLLFVCGLLGHSAFAAGQHQARPASRRFPMACFFFEPGRFDYDWDKVIPEEERSYTAGANRVYRLWCTANTSTPQQKSSAADEMAVAWKRLWDRDTPFNAAFHESGSFDLLALMGVTHELPAPMRTDANFTKDWIEDCSNACFRLDYDRASAASGRYTLMQLWLRNDVLDNLNKEPAGEPVFKMLMDAKFTLVD